MESLIKFWQKLPYEINPTLIEIGPVPIRYYGIMFFLSIFVAYYLASKRTKMNEGDYRHFIIDDYFFWVIMGVLIGGRLGYVLFYNLPYYIENPLEIISPFKNHYGRIVFIGISGMSYHGGLLGAVLATCFFAQKNEIKTWKLIDFVVPCVPAGYFFGRIGNFLNGELYGRVTEMPWGMFFRGAGENLRHPSQLYEAFFEGAFLFFVLWSLRNKRLGDGVLLGIYLIGYGAFRFFIEFFREPDSHIGLVIVSLSLGQILCIIMMLAGVFIVRVREGKIR